MSFESEFLKLRNERQSGGSSGGSTPRSSSKSSSFEETFLELRRKRKKKKEEDDIAPFSVGDSSPFPLRTASKEKKRSWFDAGAFDDGYQFGDVSKVILGTLGDLGEHLVSGVAGMGEAAIDAAAWLAPAATTAQNVQNSLNYQFDIDEYHKQQKDTQEFIQKDLYDEEKVAKAIISNPMKTILNVDTEEDSLLGEKTDSLVQSAGQLGATIGLQAIGVPWWLTTGATSFGGEVEGAFNEGANYDEAGLSAAVAAGSEILTEKLSGGIKFGGKALDDVLTNQIARNVSNKAIRTLLKLGQDMVGEGAEEVLSGVMSAIGQKMTYADDKELNELFSSEEAWESFIGGAALGGTMGGINAIRSNSKGVDYVSELTDNEQKVVEQVYKERVAEAEEKGKVSQREKAKIYDRVLNDMDKGYISTDTIESVLGGETYKSYKDTSDYEDSVLKEYEELGKKQNATLAEQSRYNELSQQVKDIKESSQRTQLKTKLGEEVFGLVKGDRLAESYNERGRKSQAYEADLSQYDTKQQAVIQKAVDSGILNNTNRTHEFVDFISKISADKGVLFDFTNNEKLKGSGFAVEGKQVNGYVTKDGITLNIDSAKAMESTVGHEITHVLEGTEFYDSLKQTIFDYAKAKGDYQGRYDSLTEMYKDVEADVEKELTADLVGDYLFSDPDFVSNLSTQNRNVFQKIYDEIKYLCKVVTAGSKEARQLEKVKREFEKAYREGGKNTEVKAEDFYDSAAKYSLRVTDKDTLDFLDKQDTVTTYKTMQLVDGKLYPPMAARVEGKYEDYSELGTWEQATERPDLIKNGKFKLDKGKGQGSIEAAYNPYMHSSNLVLNDQFSGAYNRNNLVTVECEVPVSEMTSGYHAEHAKDSVGWHAWHTGTVAGHLRKAKGTERQVFLSRWIKPVRIVPDSEVAAMYKELLDGTDIEVPDNVVTPSLLNELKSAGVKIKESGRVKYSLSDSDGKQLTKEQQEFFKDSKVRDDNGSLKVMYHGTPNGDFTVFKDGTYFTDNKEYADTYHNPGASSISTGKEAKNPKTFEVYLDIKKPFDLGDAEARRIYINDYIKGGNAMGINPYLSDAEYAKIKTIDWTEGEDLRDFLIENEYDYDGLVLDEGATGGYGDEVKSRGKSYVVFSPEQVKNIDNLKPTSDPDIRFSLSKPVEETKDLMALHNLTSEKLLKSLKLGGMPMPSVAIARAKDGHSEFGEITLVLPKETIDPQASSRNKLYSGDAWTPTYPKVDYKLNSKALKQIRDKINGLVPANVQEFGRLHLDSDNMEDTLNRYNGDMVDAFKDNDALKYAYLMEAEADVQLPMKEKNLSYSGSRENGAIIKVAEAIGADDIQKALNGGSEEIRKLEPAVRKAVAEYVRETYGDDQFILDTFAPEEGLSFSDLDGYLVEARKYLRTGIEQTVDTRPARELIRDMTVQYSYENWLKDLFSGIVEKEGIRNDKDYFTPSGNRRSFEALHYEHNLENVIKAMREKGEKGIGFGGGSIFGASTTEFSSVEEMKQASGRLQQMSEEEYQEIKDGFTQRFFELASSLPNNKNSFMATDDAATALTEAVAKYKTRSGMANYLRRELKGWATYSPQVVDDLIELVNDIRSMPTGYFEAKPQRAVGFDEVGVFVIPYDADVKLKQELLNRGYSIAEYDPKVEGDRQRVVNQFEDLKFSLSNVGEQHTSNSLSALRLDAPVVENATTAEDSSTVAENETVAPTVSETESVREMFPDDGLAEQGELEDLISEEAEIRGVMEAYAGVGDIEAVNKLLPEHEKIQKRIRELQSQETERAESLTDADVPPEMDAPFYGESDPEYVDNPFDERDWNMVGNRKVKAYMYENPEVKPFFQAEAQNLLGELNDTQRGERIYNDQVYYDSGGEKGWMGVKRLTSESMETLLDGWGMSYADIEKGLNAIIEDHGAENIAAAKKIEFMLNDRLLNGYKDFYSNSRIQPNQDYIDLLQEKQINEYSKESFDRFVATADDYAPTVDAPMMNQPAQDTNVAPTYERADGQQTYIPNRATYDAMPGDDIAPLFDATGKKGVPDGQQAFMEDAGVEKKATRKELHQRIVDNVKAKFKESGLDLDKVLKNAKNLSTFATVDNTPQRVMEKALGYKEGGILADLTVNKAAQNETDGIKWVNSMVAQLKEISKQYNIKPGSKESAAAQMYAEGFYVNENNDIVRYGDPELIQDFPDANVRKNIKGLARDTRIRKIYDVALTAINESRVRNGYSEIPRLDNYFLHFRAMEDTFSRLGIPFNPNDIRAKDLPTDLNGVTADLKPGQPYFASAMHRTGKRTSFDMLGGIERYLNSAKNQIYHIDDIQTLRALRNYIADTYGQAKGLEDIDSLSDAEAEERINQVYSSHLSTFAKFLNEEANVLAGKTALIDRGIEGIIGRRGITFLDTLNKQVGSNMVGYNISSSLTNFLPVVQTFAKTNKFDFIKAFGQTVSGKINSLFGISDGFVENSPVIIRRKGTDRFYRTAWQKVADPGYALMSAVDDISTELIARTKYNELTRKGMDSQKAHYETDKWVSRLMGDRSLGQQPQLYNSKMLGLITKFQLEVRNQLDSQFYDTIQETKVSNEHIQNKLVRNAKTAVKVASTFGQLAVVQHLFGKAFESVAGYNPAFDIVEVLLTALGYDDEEESEDTALDNIEQAFFAMLEDLPYASTFTGGGRIPISSALPIKELVMGEDQYGNEKSRWETLGEVAPYYLLPGGYGQIKKTAQGLGMFSDEHPIAGSYTDSGNLRFPVEDTLGNRVKAGIFGQYANENARDYFDNDRRALKEKQIQEFVDVGIPWQDYLKYQDGLSKQETWYGAADYIATLDLPVEKRNILINNFANREEPIDLTGYENYPNFEEFDWATKYPEKYEFLREHNITAAEYKDFSEDKKEAYTWAFNNPEAYTMSKAVSSDVVAYRSYISDLYDLKADKDENGKTINGSAKAKKLDYINNLDIDYGEKIVLFKSLYEADDTYNYEIIDYLNNREDISYEEMETILKYLGFEVDSDGNITW